MASDPTQEQAPPELLLELNFVPTWARKPPGVNPYAGVEGEDRGDRRRPRGRWDERPRRRAPEGGERRGRPPSERGDRRRPSSREGFGGRGGPRPDRADRPRPAADRDRERQREAPGEFEDLPVTVSFVPERKRLGAVVRQIHSSSRAYPLMDVASLFLSDPEHYLVKIEVREEREVKDGPRLHQCAVCKAVFLDHAEAVAHALAAHAGEYYDAETVQSDPPPGNFVCVGRCRLSGVLVGPPNYHGFNEKVQELHRTRFAHMPLEAYRQQIEMLREPELIEKWKEECRTHTVYRPRGADPATPVMTWQEAEAHFMREHAPTLAQVVTRVLLPAATARKMEQGPLRRTVGEAWARESRHPMSLSLALRPAFRHMRLHLFSAGGGSASGGKAHRGATFVTPVRPRPIDPARAVATIREVLTFLQEHPGCTRRQLVEGLRPGMAPESHEVAAALSPLRWLIERGHVVEFFNGTLAVPTGGGAHRGKERAARSD
ncbi:MAG: hypothetical protein JXB04_01350 [Kiritimatiellae bacterium]|nr:hypothetical protein [Kiritimatiellia bacterium]